MQGSRLEGSANTRFSNNHTRDGLYEDPPNVGIRVVVPGMMSPVGWLNELKIHEEESTLVDGRSFKWDAFEIPALRLSHPAHLMLIEGVVPAWLFMGAHLESIKPGVRVNGPLMLLRVDYPALHTAPFILKDVVFGVPHSIPEGAKIGDLLPVMAYSVLTKPLS